MSISSSEGSPLPVDLANKYQKLAAEYAKVRAQVAVLKKGIVDEQSRSSDMKEQLKMKDQIIRKHDQELDSLVFRNQQLTKRVTILQEELELQIGNKRVRSKPENNISEESKLFQEELQKRILENAQLMSRLNEKEIEFEKEQRAWKESIASLEKTLQAAQTCKNNQVCNCDDLKQKLATLEIRYKNRSEINGKLPQTSSQETWSLIKDLSIIDLISLIERLAICCGYDFNSSVSVKAFNDSNQSAVASALQRHSSEITVFVFKINESDSALKEIFLLLKDLEAEIVRTLSSYPASTMHPISNAMEEIILALYNASESYLAWAQSEASESPGLIETLKCIQNKSRFVRAMINERKSEINKNTSLSVEPKRMAESPCKSCQTLSAAYQQKISELNKYILTLPEKLKNELKCSESAIKLENSSLDSINIQNELGECTLALEPVWSAENFKDFVLRKCSNALADVQLAESKLSRISSERDAAQSRLEHCVDELQKRESLVSRLEEELSVTSRSYKDQLNSMTEHMANLSDKLAAQQTVIEDLTYELSSKELKKGKAK